MREMRLGMFGERICKHGIAEGTCSLCLGYKQTKYKPGTDVFSMMISSGDQNRIGGIPREIYKFGLLVEQRGEDKWLRIV